MDIESEITKRPFNILVADDDPNARMLLELSIGEISNLNLLIFENGEEAISSLNNSLPDFAILDVQMPGASGIEVCMEIKKQSHKCFIPVILLTSQSELTDKVNGLNCGADDYITKPFDVTELEARVKALLRIKVLTDELRETKHLLKEKDKELIAMQVAGAAAHELGQPLTTVMLQFQLIQLLDKNSPKFNETIEELKTECVKMKEILQKLNNLKSYKTKNYTEDLKILDI